MASSQRWLDEVDREMQHVLLQLAMASEGSVASRDADTGGGSARHYEDVPLAEVGQRRGDTAVEHYRWLYRHAETKPERQTLLAAAKLKLHARHHSQADFDVVDESADELYDRIIDEGEDFPARMVANNLNTTITIVRAVRRERGRDESKGRPVEDLRGAGVTERRQRVRQLAREYAAESPPMGPRAIAHSLSVPYTTVVRDLDAR